MSEDEHHHCQGGHGPGISCAQINEFLLAYVERDLEGEVHAQFEQHLGRCPPCGHYLDGYRDTIDLVRKCGREDAKKPEPPPEDLIQAILRAKALSSDS